MTYDLAKAIRDATRANPLARVGVVKTGGAALQLATVTIDGADNVCVVLNGITLAANDVVLVLKVGNQAGYVLGKIGATAAPPADVVKPPVNTEPGVRKRSATIKPIFTGTYRGGKWRTDTDSLYQGDYGSYGLNQGCAFYGSALKALGAVTTKPYSIRVAYKRLRGGDYAATSPSFYTLTQKTKPGGAPTRDDGPSSGDAVGVQAHTTESWTLPATMALHLLNGTDGGLGIYCATSTPYLALAGRSDYAAAMVLSVDYYA